MSLVQPLQGSTPHAVTEVKVNLRNMADVLAAALARLRQHEGFTLFTVNLDHIVKLGESEAFRQAYSRANFVTADGWPVVWHIRKKREQQLRKRANTVERRRVERTTGADLLAPMCQLSAEHGFPMYFVGPGPQSQDDGIEILRNRHPGLVLAGMEAPKLPAAIGDADIDAMAERIRASGARVCILSLGAPKQELLADALHLRCPDVGFLCVGAALDFISGHAVRAPALFQRFGMEWFWRLVMDPVRLGPRYARCGLALLKLRMPALFPQMTRLGLAE
ncbi:MAG: WecB/TagA/CpsF family glycosyltransferase [Hyphomicrobiales bacterium]|nr:WecB/TagA/CpsF family glycosyltransferase [Hyphomicrobiales bacterium]